MAANYNVPFWGMRRVYIFGRAEHFKNLIEIGLARTSFRASARFRGTQTLRSKRSQRHTRSLR